MKRPKKTTANGRAAKRRETLLHFAGRHAMNIDGLGDKIVDQLVEKGMVKDVADLYELKLDEVAALDRRIAAARATLAGLPAVRKRL